MDTLHTPLATLDEVRAVTLTAIATSGLPQPAEIMLSEYQFPSRGTCRALRLRFDSVEHLQPWGRLIGALTETDIPEQQHRISSAALEWWAIDFVFHGPRFLGMWNQIKLYHFNPTSPVKVGETL